MGSHSEMQAGHWMGGNKFLLLRNETRSNDMDALFELRAPAGHADYDRQVLAAEPIPGISTHRHERLRFCFLRYPSAGPHLRPALMMAHNGGY